MECLCVQKRISIPKKTYFTCFPKIRVSRKRQKCRFCQANPAFCFLSVLRNLYIRGEAVLSSLLLLFPKRKITSGYLYQTRKKTRTFAKQPCEEYGNLCNSNPVSFTIHSQFLKTLSGAIQCNLFLFIFADKITIHNSSS